MYKIVLLQRNFNTAKPIYYYNVKISFSVEHLTVFLFWLGILFLLQTLNSYRNSKKSSVAG